MSHHEPLPERPFRPDSSEASDDRFAADPLRRPHVPALDAILGKPFRVLDDGFVRVLDYMGDDAAVVQAARISYGAGTKQVHEDRGLIRYLMRHQHTTPQEMCDIKFHVRVPMDTWRQWVRHRTACLAAGTKLIFDLPGGVRRGGRQAYPINIENLYRKFQPTSNRTRPDKQRNPRFRADRVRAMLLRQMNEDTGLFQHTRVAHVYRNGVKPVFRMILTDGKAIECTVDHRFSFADGWKTLAAATGLRLQSGRAVWDAGRYEVYVNGTEVGDEPVHHDRSWLNQQYKCHDQVHLDEMAYVSRLSGAPVTTQWVKRPRRAVNKLVAGKLVAIERFEYAGEKETYDVEVEGPYHNFVANGIVTHNSVNEYSTRYSVAIDAAQETPPDQWRLQSALNRQGSAGTLPRTIGEKLSAAERALQDEARRVYEERLAAGVAREQARKDLPLSTYTEAYWKTNLHNLLHFLALRMDDHAQEEIRAYARVIGEEITAKWVPVVWEAFLDYRRHALQLSGIEVQLLRLIGGNDRAAAIAAAERHGWLSRRKDGSLARNRERAEFEAKLAGLGLQAPWA
jgi:flavin-dependent thymidylate synthase